MQKKFGSKKAQETQNKDGQGTSARPIHLTLPFLFFAPLAPFCGQTFSFFLIVIYVRDVASAFRLVEWTPRLGVGTALRIILPRNLVKNLSARRRAAIPIVQ